MATIPAAGQISDSLRTEGEVKADLEAVIASLRQVPGAASVELAVTIAGGSITPAGGGGIIVVDTEAAAATDDLANILQTNYPDNACILVRNANAARVVTLKHAATGSGQMFFDRSVDHVLDDTKKWMLLQRRGSDWHEVLRGPSRLAMPVVVKSANFTIQKEDAGKVFICDDILTVSFAAAASLGAGFCVGLINTSAPSNDVTLDPSGSERVDERTSLRLSRGRGTLLVCDGTDFWTIGNQQVPRYSLDFYASSLTLNVSNGDYIEVTALTGNVTTLTVNGEVGVRTRIRFKQDGTGGRTVASPAGAKISGSIDATANKVSYLDLYFSVVDLRWEGAWSTVPV